MTRCTKVLPIHTHWVRSCKSCPYGQTYGPCSAPVDEYSKQPSATYPQHGVPPTPLSDDYQYSSLQPNYSDQFTQTYTSYGYGVTPAGRQPGNVLPPNIPFGYYGWSMPPQSGYGGATAAASHAKSDISSQIGYGGDVHCDSAQI